MFVYFLDVGEFQLNFDRQKTGKVINAIVALLEGMPVLHALSQLDRAIEWISTTSKGCFSFLVIVACNGYNSLHTLEGGIASEITSAQGLLFRP